MPNPKYHATRSVPLAGNPIYESSGDGLSPGAIAGIVIGVVVVVLGIGVTLYFLKKSTSNESNLIGDRDAMPNPKYDATRSVPLAGNPN